VIAYRLDRAQMSGGYPVPTKRHSCLMHALCGACMVSSSGIQLLITHSCLCLLL
jgi:hypothetical protein